MFLLNYMLQAEEITLTLGQAFDLAYRRFLDSQYKNVDTKKQMLLMQKKVCICVTFFLLSLLLLFFVIVLYPR